MRRITFCLIFLKCAAAFGGAPEIINHPLTPYFVSLSNSILVEPDFTTKNPAWVAERIALKDISAVGAVRKGSFTECDQIPAEARSKNHDWEKTVWAKGHMAAAGNHVSSADEEDATFNLANVVPQNQKMNEGAWRSIETEVRKMITRDDVAAYVVTGPAYLPRIDGKLHLETIGPGHVWVPTDLWKAVLVVWLQPEMGNGRQAAAGMKPITKYTEKPLYMRAWLMPNSDTVSSDTSHYRTTVANLQPLVHLDLFAWLDDKTEAELESKK